MKGQSFGRLTVLEYRGKTKSYDKLWLCRCQCGTEKVMSGSSLRRKDRPSQSCGCLQREITRQRIGAKNNRWNGGRSYSNGYLLLRMPEYPRADRRGYVRANIFVLEQKLGRPLASNEVAHHIDGDITNNSPDNLEPKTRFDHGSHHHSGEKCWKAKLTEEQVRKIRNSPDKTQTALAKEYGVTQAAIWYILNKRNWRTCQ